MLHAAWAVVAAVVAWRCGWMRGTRAVTWPGADPRDLMRLAIAAVVASPLAAVVGVSTGVRVGTEPSLVQLLAMTVAAGTPPILVWLWFAPWGADRARPISPALITGVIGLTACWPFLQLAIDGASRLQQALGGEPAPDLGHQTLELLRDRAGEPAAWGMALSAVLIAPLAEEITWRGLVQQALKRIRLPVAAAIGITAALFALIHWSALPPAARPGGLVALALLGATLGWLTERTGRIESAMAAHAAFNLANLLLFSMLPE
jgi:membrane protease YdiL (CAAX protease family)